MGGPKLISPTGYVFDEHRTVKNLLAVEAKLLRSEGIDPAWPRFDEPAQD